MISSLSYIFACVFVLIAHCAMLFNVFYNGSYSDIHQVYVLTGSVIGLDLVCYIIMPIFKQRTYSLNFMLIFILNISIIFQSCFGGVNFNIKYFITCIAALISCYLGYMLCRNHRWIHAKKKYTWICIGVLIIIILLFTGSRSIWIDLGFITIQPSEFIKPLMVLACAISITELQNKHKILMFDVVYDNLIILCITVCVILLQWWCCDLGSIPTFVTIFITSFMLRICYPKKENSIKTLMITGVVIVFLSIIAIIFAPTYAKERIFSDIWSDPNGSGYQQVNALIGIAEGGWFGKGPGYGSLHNIFASESDIVFATISEEWGFLCALMTVIILLIIVSMPLINPPRSYYHGMMCSCIATSFLVQMSLNVFGSCNMIPFTGVTLPFVSAGGSSMVTSGFMIGMIIAAQSPIFKAQKLK